MKRIIEKLLVMSLVSIAILSCSKEDDIIGPTTHSTVTSPKLFGVNPVIASIVPESATRGIITKFTDNDRIGLFLTAGEPGTNYMDNRQKK